MTDIVDRATRSRMMSGIRGKDTSPEILVRKFLHRAGLRFRLHVRNLPGRPDIVLPRYRTIVLVNGCFWHRHEGCRYSYMPKSRIAFWKQKFLKNVERDERNQQSLREAGWRVYVVWECETMTNNLAQLVKDISRCRTS
jgi:DNA mismatch endonuclease (patch repair protein)